MSEKNNQITITTAIIIAGLLIAGALLFVNQGGTNKAVQEEMTAEAVGEKVINYINEHNDLFLVAGVTASLAEVSDEGSVYKIKLKVEEMEFDSFASKDGIFFFPSGFDLRESLAQPETQETPAVSDLPSFPAEELTEFVACLQEAGFVVYGANWCSWTNELVQTLGGWSIVAPIYVECEEQIELCQEKEIQGYPTILINDEPFQGARTFEDFSSATSCQLPANL